MKKTILKLFIVFSLNSIFAQVEKNTYELNSINNLLTQDVKDVLDENLNDKKVVFLGESNHYFGSDLSAKSEFVKYLVLEKGYKDIAFEADFFALYFDHNPKYLYPFWSNSVQCKELFEFIKENNVTIWGFDNQLNSAYSYTYFTNKLNQYLIDNSIQVDEKFIQLTEMFFKNKDRSRSTAIIGKSNLEFLISQIEKLLKNEVITQDKLWTQFLEIYKSYIIISSTHNTIELAAEIRDNQMAKNLDYVVKSMPEKKFIVWLHNAHMIKDDYGTEPGQKMGYQFIKLNKNISYHIAFSSIHMPYRKLKMLKKFSNDEDNLLHFLPSTEKNYFINSKQIITENSELEEKEFHGMFVVRDKEPKTNWFKHYDALVFISAGEDVKYLE